MGWTVAQPLALLLLLLLPAVALLGWSRLRYLPRNRRMLILGLRLGSLALLIGALAGPALRRPDDGQAVVYVVDVSASLSADTQAQAFQWVRRADAQRRPHDQSALVVVGERAAVLRPLQAAPLPAVAPIPPTSAEAGDHAAAPAWWPPSAGTNLQEGLRLALALLPPTGQRRIVLLSDGWETIGRVDAELLAAQAAGVQIAVQPLPAAPPAPIVVEALDTPAYVREREPFEASVVIYSGVSTEGLLRVGVDGAPAVEQPVMLERGRTRVPLTTSLQTPGPHRLVAEVQADGAQAELTQAVVVKDPAHILVLEDRADESRPLVEALRQAGLEVDVRRPTSSTRPLDLAQLRPYDGVVLDNVAASTLTLDQLRALESYVHTLGRGLTVVGGNTSYALGGYNNSLLEQMLPVSAEAPYQQERASLALVLVIDRSGSMSLRTDNVSKMAMAREAALLATEALRPDDQLGVLAFDIRNDWIVPLAPIDANGGLAAVQQAIQSIEADGGTDIYPALARAYEAIVGSQARFKHIILLSDGQSWGGAYDQLLEQMRANGVTLSTIGVGQDIDAQLMSALARGGLGRYYFTDRVREIPRIMLRETNVVTRPVAMEGRVVPRVAAASPLLRGLAPAELPALNGYVVTSPKPTAEIALQSERGDPLLASWQYGLGRVAAWTADAGTPWSAEWLGWPRFSQFWSQIVRWTLPPAAQGDLQVLLRTQPPRAPGAGPAPKGTEVQVRVEALREDGAFLDDAPTEARIQGPTGQVVQLPLPQVGPGRYESHFLADRPGLYKLEVVQALPSGARHEQAALVVAADPERAHVGANEALLARLARDTGGRVLSEPTRNLAQPDEGRAALTAGERWQPIGGWLVVLALLLFTMDVAARRLRWPWW